MSLTRQSTTQALLSDFRNFPELQDVHLVELMQVAQSVIVLLHKIHLLIGVLLEYVPGSDV